MTHLPSLATMAFIVAGSDGVSDAILRAGRSELAHAGRGRHKGHGIMFGRWLTCCIRWLLNLVCVVCSVFGVDSESKHNDEQTMKEGYGGLLVYQLLLWESKGRY